MDIKSRIQLWAKKENEAAAEIKPTASGRESPNLTRSARPGSYSGSSKPGSQRGSFQLPGPSSSVSGRRESELSMLERTRSGASSPAPSEPASRRPSSSLGKIDQEPSASDPSTTQKLNDLQQRLDQMTVDHHLALSYLIEAETRRKYASPNSLDKYEVKKQHDVFHEIPNATSTDNTIKNIEDDTAEYQRNVDHHLMLSYLIESETLKRDQGLSNPSEAPLTPIELRSYQNTVDKHLMMSYMLEAQSLRQNFVSLPISTKPKSAEPLSPNTPFQSTVDRHLMLSYMLEAETLRNSTYVGSTQQKQPTSPVSSMKSPFQSTVDKHLMLSYMLESQTLKNRLTSPKDQKTVDNDLMLSYMLEAETYQRALTNEVNEYQQTVDQHLMMSYLVETETLKMQMKKEGAEVVVAPVMSGEVENEQAVVDYHLMLSYFIEAETVKRDNAPKASNSVNVRSSPAIAEYVYVDITEAPEITTTSSKILVDAAALQQLLKSTSVNQAQIENLTAQNHLYQSYVNDIAYMLNQIDTTPLPPPPPPTPNPNRLSMFASNSSLSAAFRSPTPTPQTTPPAPSPPPPSSFAATIQSLHPHLQSISTYKTLLSTTEARLRARDTYLQNTIMDTARRVQELEGQLAEMEGVNEDLRRELGRVQREKEVVEMELGDLEDDHLVLQNQVLVGGAAASGAPVSGGVVGGGRVGLLEEAVERSLVDEYVLLRDIDTQTDPVGVFELKDLSNGIGNLLPHAHSSPVPKETESKSVGTLTTESTISTETQNLDVSNKLAFSSLILSTQSETIQQLETLLSIREKEVDDMSKALGALKVDFEKVGGEKEVQEKRVEGMQKSLRDLEEEVSYLRLQLRARDGLDVSTTQPLEGAERRRSLDDAMFNAKPKAETSSRRPASDDPTPRYLEMVPSKEEMVKLLQTLHGHPTLNPIPPTTTIANNPPSTPAPFSLTTPLPPTPNSPAQLRGTSILSNISTGPVSVPGSPGRFARGMLSPTSPQTFYSPYSGPLSGNSATGSPYPRNRTRSDTLNSQNTVISEDLSPTVQNEVLGQMMMMGGAGGVVMPTRGVSLSQAGVYQSVGSPLMGLSRVSVLGMTPAGFEVAVGEVGLMERVGPGNMLMSGYGVGGRMTPPPFEAGKGRGYDK
ncbi:hypothetical protein HDV05_004672 [Chytridiales sp. JEL 0842]|nr:hypothetical protein HDV05_004672 [Chytridiales sp. JEL 0842]